jgi:hypothetical protein
MQAKDYPKACALFAASMKEDPQTGTHLNLARCHELEGKTATAWGEYNDVVERAHADKQKERVAYAQKAADALAPKLSRLTVSVASPADGETITVDGQPIVQQAWGNASPIDPGEHKLEASAPGRKTAKQAFTVVDGKSLGVRVPALETEAPGAMPTPLPAGSTPSAGTESQGGAPVDSGSSSSSDASGKRTAGFVLAGVGVAALAAGVVTGLLYLGKQSDWKNCNGATPCDSIWDSSSDADSVKSSANTLGWISTVGFGLGVVGIGVGSYLILTTHPKASSSARVRIVPGLGGGALVGSF